MASSIAHSLLMLQNISWDSACAVLACPSRLPVNAKAEGKFFPRKDLIAQGKHRDQSWECPCKFNLRACVKDVRTHGGCSRFPFWDLANFSEKV